MIEFFEESWLRQNNIFGTFHFTWEKQISRQVVSGYFLHKKSCSKTSVEKNYKNWVKLKYWIWKSNFTNSFDQLGKNMWFHLQYHAQRDVIEIIPSRLVIPPWLKKSAYKGETKIILSPFLSVQASHINSPRYLLCWKFCLWISMITFSGLLDWKITVHNFTPTVYNKPKTRKKIPAGDDIPLAATFPQY